MLSRVAQRVYWLGRYLERVENTARLINVHTALLMDLPGDARLDWFTLITIFDADEAYFEKHERSREYDIMHFLLADESYGSSLVNAVSAVRENARTSLDVLPEELWNEINALNLLVKSELSSVGNRSRRQKLLLTIMESCQVIWGTIVNQMSRNTVYDFMQTGKYLERADMTSRILEVTSMLVTDKPSPELTQFQGMLWGTLLKALSARTMFTQANNSSSLKAEVVLAFLVNDTAFPRSLTYSVKSIGRYLDNLPGAEKTIKKQRALVEVVNQYEFEQIPVEKVKALMDELQVGLNELSINIRETWFYPDYSAV